MESRDRPRLPDQDESELGFEPRMCECRAPALWGSQAVSGGFPSWLHRGKQTIRHPFLLSFVLLSCKQHWPGKFLNKVSLLPVGHGPGGGS